MQEERCQLKARQPSRRPLTTCFLKETGEVRPCLDVRDLIKAIIHENHKPQTVEEIAHQLAGVVVYTKADVLKGFLQVHLIKESSNILVINTHKGRYRFKRMLFGAKMSQDVFQMKIDLIIKKCPGVISIHHDIVIYGTSDQDHDANLINLLQTCWVQQGGNAPLPQEDTRHHRDDPSHRQTATSKLHWNGNIHGKLCATSHRTTESNAQAKCYVSLGWNFKLQLPENQTLNCQKNKPTTLVL